MRKYIAVIFLVCFAPALPASGQQVYKWQDEQGRWHISNSPGKTQAPAFRITVERISHQSGHIRVEGTAENISGVLLPSPKIKIVGLDAMDRTIYDQSSTWPGGDYDAKIAPGQSAVFNTLLSIPQKARGKEIRLELSADGQPFEVYWKQEGRIKIW